MSEFKSFIDIELNYKVENIEYKNIKIWPILKPVLFSNVSSDNRKSKKEQISKFRKIRPAFFNIYKLFKRNYKYILFTDTLEKRWLNNLYVDKTAQGIIDYLGQDNFLIIENPVNDFHYSIKQCKAKNIVSLRFFQILSYALSKLNLKNISLDYESKEILSKISRELNVDVNYKKILKNFFAYVKVFKVFFSYLKPEIIFINCYYSLAHMAAIYVAKNMKIKTVELQHGIINDKHLAYNFVKNFGNDLFPDYLFVYGKFFKNFFHDKNYFINSENVYSVGYYYPEKLKEENEFNALKSILDIKSNNSFHKIIVISSQITIEEELMNFMLNVAKRDPENLYVFRPRIIYKNYNTDNKPHNFYLSLKEEEDIYRLLKIADIHVTVYSTVCLESLYFGVPNIMVNIRNLAKLSFGDILKDERHTVYVETEEDFLSVINSWQFMEKHDIMRYAEIFFESNHNLRLREALNIILNISGNKSRGEKIEK